MKKLQKLRNYLMSSALLILSFSCGDDEENGPVGLYEGGVFVVNEGPFQTGSGTISFFHPDSTSIIDDIFATQNGRPLGNIVQSMQIHEDRGYIVVNNSNKVEVVDASDFSSLGAIEGLELPRYFVGFSEDKGYVSLWGEGSLAGAVAVVDLNSMTITKTIETGLGSEEMLLADDQLYVCNGGVFGVDNTVSVINTTTDELITDIEVGDNPTSIAVDANGFIWVACSGNKVFNNDFTVNVDMSTSGSIVQVDPSNNSVLGSFVFEDVLLSPSRLAVSPAGTTLYYLLAGSIFSQEANNMTAAPTALIAGFFYGMEVDPQAGLIYASDPGDFVSSGKVIRFNANGSALDTLSVGVIPGNFFFN